MKQPGCKIPSDKHRVSSAGRSWNNSCGDHHPTHPQSFLKGPGLLGSQEWRRLAVTSASKLSPGLASHSPTLQLCPCTASVLGRFCLHR